MTGLARKITFSGDQEYANTFVSKACGMLDIFAANLSSQKKEDGTFLFPIDKDSYISLVVIGQSASIHIHAVSPLAEKNIEIPMTKRDVRCHWNKKALYVKIWNSVEEKWRYIWPFSFITFAAHGFGMIIIGDDFSPYIFSEYVFGERLSVLMPAEHPVNASFYEDGVFANQYPAYIVSPPSGHSTHLRTGTFFFLITKEIWNHTALLAVDNSYFGLGWYRAMYMTGSIGGLVPAAPGQVQHSQGQMYDALSPEAVRLQNKQAYGAMFSNANFKFIYRKSKTKFLHHGANPDDEMRYVDIKTAEVQLSSACSFIGYNPTNPLELPVHAPFFIKTGLDFLSFEPTSFQDCVGPSIVAYLTGTTEVDGLSYEWHGDINVGNFLDPEWREADHYVFTSIYNVMITIKSFNEDGSVIDHSGIAAINKTSRGATAFIDSPFPYIKTTQIAIPQQPGCVIRDLGGCQVTTMKGAFVISTNRNAVFIVDFNDVLHDEFTYNAFINFGSGFNSFYIDPVNIRHIKYPLSFSENGLNLFSRLNEPFSISLISITDTPMNIISVVETFNFINPDDVSQREIRVFHSKNYRWIVVYNSDKDGVYELSDGVLSRIGDATGVEPVEMALDESYILMQDKAYGAISGSFSRLIGFFYDGIHYAEMQSREEDDYKRFVIKNNNAGHEDQIEVDVLEWGMYSFYEASEDTSFVVISNCSVNGVDHFEDSRSAMVINFADGPFEFESACVSITYPFTIDVPGGFTETEIGGASHAPELASIFFGPNDREPPYGRKMISICYCGEDIWGGSGWVTKRHRHHVMTYPVPGQGFCAGDQYCRHRPGTLHQRSSTAAVRTLYKKCKQQRDLYPAKEKNIITLVGLAGGQFYERVSDDFGSVDKKLLDSGEYVTDVFEIKQS